MQHPSKFEEKKPIQFLRQLSTAVNLKNYNSSIVFCKCHSILPFFFVSNTVRVSIVSLLAASTSDTSSDSSCCSGSSTGVGLWSGSSSDSWWGSSAKGIVSCAENKATTYLRLNRRWRESKFHALQLQFNAINLSLAEKKMTKDMLRTPDVKYNEPDAREDFVWY